MKLDVPFYENITDGSQCLQVSMQSILKCFLDKEYSVEELDYLTKRKPKKWSHFAQGVKVFHDLGLDVTYYSIEDLEPFLGGIPYLRERFGKDAEEMIAHGDVPTVTAAIKDLLNYNVFEKKLVSYEELTSFVDKKYICIALVDWDKLIGRNKTYQGHFVIITGYDKENIYIHHSGPTRPQANMAVSTDVFMKAWSANGTDNDLVVVRGKR